VSQVFYHYTELEEHPAGLWRITKPDERERYIDASYRLMRNPKRFLEAMLRAVKEWPKSMEASMTTPSLNQRAWMGHAGCCIAVGSPEDLTRLGWHRLTPKQQDKANAAADEAIEFWQSHKRVEAMPERSLWDA
jgi:hypothetical protein